MSRTVAPDIHIFTSSKQSCVILDLKAPAVYSPYYLLYFLHLL